VIFDQKLVVIALDDWESIGILQSRVHEEWALFFGSTLEDRPVYTPSDCFETFPFPEETGIEAVKRSAQEYCEYRASLMTSHGEGLTETYNRFHDPEETRSDILRLRELHTSMDGAALNAYGWSDIQSTPEFIRDYESGEDDESPRSRRKKQAWRCRWPDEVRDEVLARLLELNTKRAKEQAAARMPSENGPRQPNKKRESSKTREHNKNAAAAEQRGLFGKERDE
jgi:hypothetical protein